MRYLFDDWEILADKIRGRYAFLFLDYDGTLVPIADRPEKAILPEDKRGLLSALSLSPGCKVAVISGRSLEDIKDLVGIKEIIYVGNHGFEIEGPKIKYKKFECPSYRKTLERLKNDLEKRLSGIQGVWVEDKGLSLALHYRLAEKEGSRMVKDIFNRTTASFAGSKQVRLSSGKMYLEIRPPADWDKGKVVLWLLARQQFALKGKDVFPVYVGDDSTDEDAFKALKNRGLTIAAGGQKGSWAQYYVKDTAEAGLFLEKIKQLLAERR